MKIRLIKISAVFWAMLITMNVALLQAQQKIIISGQIIDRETRQSLPYANIHVENTYQGTISNPEGGFEISLDSAAYSLKITYIGYRPEILKVNRSVKNILIEMKPQPIQGETIIVYSEFYNWVEKFILQAIKVKHELKNNLSYYQALAYSKTSLSFTQSKQIFGIIEAVSDIGYQAPDKYHEVVRNLQKPPHLKNLPYETIAINQNIDLYNEMIKIKRFSIPSPLHDEALKYYDYEVKKKYLSGQDTIICINIAPKSTHRALFYGELFFVEKSQQLIEARLFGNNSAQDEISDSLSLFIKYRVDSLFIVPIFTKFNLRLNFMGIFYHYTQENSFVNYAINDPSAKPRLSLDRFIAIEPNLAYDIGLMREKTFRMPLTEKEQQHERQIEKIFINAPLHRRIMTFLFTDLLPLSYDQPGSLGNVKIERLSNWYHFNKVEGHFLGAEYQLLQKNLFSVYAHSGYSFAREAFNYHLRIRARNSLFESENSITNLNNFDYNKIGQSLSSLLFHQDSKIHYYHSISNRVSYSLDLFKKFNARLVLHFEKQAPVTNLTNYSIFNKNKAYSPNFLIQKHNNNKFGFELNYIQNQDFIKNRPIIYHGSSFSNISLAYERQDKSILQADENRSIFHLVFHRYQAIVNPLALDFKMIWHKQDRSRFIQESNFTSRAASAFLPENNLEFFTIDYYEYYVDNYLKLDGDLTLFKLPGFYTFRMSCGAVLKYLKSLDSFEDGSGYFKKLNQDFYEYGVVVKGVSIFNCYLVTNNLTEKKFKLQVRMNF